MYNIYFIQEGDEGPIKIGHAKHPIDRLISLQTGNPSELKLRACFPGYVRDEIALHKEFEAYRIRGEWFEPAEEILSKINKIGPPKRVRTRSPENNT